MSEKTDARHIARRLGWDYTRSLYFVRDNVALALEMRGEGDTDTVREALTELAEAAMSEKEQAQAKRKYRGWLAREIQHKLGWGYERALAFVIAHAPPSASMNRDGDSDSAKDAIMELAEAANE